MSYLFYLPMNMLIFSSLYIAKIIKALLYPKKVFNSVVDFEATKKPPISERLKKKIGSLFL